jgi:microcystin-dependent protein
MPSDVKIQERWLADNLFAQTLLQVGGIQKMSEIGKIEFFGGDIPAATHLVCDGSEVGTEYASLRNYLIDSGSPFGTANGNPLLPDLRGRVVGITGDGTGLTSRSAGDIAGSETQTDVPQHNHGSGTLVTQGSSSTANSQEGSNRVLGRVQVYRDGPADEVHHASSIGGSTANTGESGGVSIMQPTLFLNSGIRYAAGC